MDSLKICFFIPEHNQETPTHFSYLYDFIRILSRDLDIFLAAERGWGRPDFLSPGKFRLQRFSFPPLRFLENMFLILRVRFWGYNDFYVHYSFLSALNASLIVKIFGGRVFYWNCGSPWLYQRNFLRRMLEKIVYHSVDFLVTGTEGLKKEYAKHYRLSLAKIKVMPNWIDLEKAKNQKAKVKSIEMRRQLNIASDSKIILFVHRLSKRKGAHYLPEIINQLRKENIIMLIIGRGPEEERIRASIRDCRLEDKARFVGWVPQQAIFDYYGLADIFIMPSEEEGFPHVFLEAMAAGVPFVAFDVGGVREMAPEAMSQYLVRLGDLREFSDKVRELLSKDRRELTAMSSLLKEWVIRYDLPTVAQVFKKLISVETR